MYLSTHKQFKKVDAIMKKMHSVVWLSRSKLPRPWPAPPRVAVDQTETTKVGHRSELILSGQHLQ
jgi:hypothetical protein